MLRSSKPVHSAVLAGFVVLAGCGSKGGARVDGAEVGDSSVGRLPDVETLDGAATGGPADALLASSPDVPATGMDGRDGSTREAFSGDRGYLPVDPPDGGIPGCIWTLLRQCCGSPTDLCISEIINGGVSGYVCWPTGELNVVDSTGGIVGYASDGTVCYTQKLTHINGTDLGMAFYDSTGTEVATYRYIQGSQQVEVACDGATFLTTPYLNCLTAIGNCKRGICPR